MKKKTLFIIITIIILLSIISIITLLYFTTDLFKSNEELFWKYFSQNKDVLSVLNNDKLTSLNEFKKNNSYTSSGNLKFVIKQGKNSFKQFNATTQSRYDINTKRKYSDITLKNGELNLLTLSYINSGDIYGIKCDEVFDNYIGIRSEGLLDLLINHNIQNTENIPENTNENEYKDIFSISEEQKNHFIDVYVPIVLENIGADKYTKSKEQIIIDNEESGNLYTYNTNLYTLKLSGKDVKNILIQCLETLKNDTKTLIWLNNKCTLLGIENEFTDSSNISIKVQEYINKLQDEEIEDSIEIYVYEYDGKLIKTRIVIQNRCEIIFENIPNYQVFTVNLRNTLIRDDLEQEQNTDVIDLNIENEMEKLDHSQIVLKKINNNSVVTNKINIIPDMNNPEKYISFVADINEMQNDTSSNYYTLEINNSKDDKIEKINIEYDSTILKQDQVEEIEELTSNNTAIADNYDSEVFEKFLKNWCDLFMNELSDRMTTLGFEEFANS